MKKAQSYFLNKKKKVEGGPVSLSRSRSQSENAELFLEGAILTGDVWILRLLFIVSAADHVLFLSFSVVARGEWIVFPHSSLIAVLTHVHFS